MDKIDALKISRRNLNRVMKSDLDFTEARLFGSYMQKEINMKTAISI